MKKLSAGMEGSCVKARVGAYEEFMTLPILQPRAPRPPRKELPTLKALEDLTREVMATPLWKPSRLVRYLKLRRRMALRLLDPKRMRMVTPHGKVNDCGSCSDSCCIGVKSTVLLRLRDIAVLMDTGNASLMTHQKPTFEAKTLRARPALRRQLGSQAWQTMPVLKQNAFGACMALNTEGRCTLYPHWPMSCARFPFSLDVEAQEVFYAGRCQSFWIHPDQSEAAQAMAAAATQAYNARIEDAVVLTFARTQLARLGITRYLAC